MEQALLPLTHPANDEVTIEHDGKRWWLEIDQTTHEKLNALEGDVLDVDFGHARVAGIMGSRARKQWRVWLVCGVDVDAVESVTLRRVRRV